MRKRPLLPLPAGEKALAWALTDDGTPVVGTRDALYVGTGADPVRLGWEQVERADWDSETGVLAVVGVGAWGEQKPRHDLPMAEPGRLLELVRERVTASVVLQRHFAVPDGQGQQRRNGPGGKVIARRAPSGDRPIEWFHEFDAGVDPDAPEVRRAAAEALARAREETGL